ncbi:hypothetical protein CLAIMM_13969 [Cladophialophora immunda]|nr:hypothetical protein CLAIMM_13969 [Cladophialophora immunda]
MGRIYGSAVRTIADLGEWIRNSQDGAQLAEKVSRLLTDKSPSSMERRDTPTSLALLGQWLTEYDLPDMSDPIWKEVMSILRRLWFRRVWIIQEFALSAEINFLGGTDLISIDDFVLLKKQLSHVRLFLLDYAHMSVFEQLETSKNITAQNTLFDVRTSIKSRHPLPLPKLLNDSRNFYASDPRDKIFALFALASDAQELGLRADYSLSTIRVFHQTARALLEKQNAIEVLFEVGSGSLFWILHSIDSPSWVPDWGPTFRYSLGLVSDNQELGYGRASHGAAGASEAKICFPSKTRLVVRGAIVDEVTAGGRPYLIETPNLSALDCQLHRSLFEFHSEARTLVQTLKHYPAGEGLLEAFSRTLTLNKLYDQELAENNASVLMEAYAAFNSFRELSGYRRPTTWELTKLLARAMVTPFAPDTGSDLVLSN